MLRIMQIKKKTLDNLLEVISGITDVLGVGLFISDGKGSLLSGWCYSTSKMEEKSNPNLLPIGGSKQAKKEACIIEGCDGRRQFAVYIGKIENTNVFVQSEDLPEHFAWIDGELEPQILPGCRFFMIEKAEFLLYIYVRTVCLVVAEELQNSRSIDDLDIENIRRIGICLGKKIVNDKDNSNQARHSLGGVPSLEAFFIPSESDERRSATSSVLTKIFRYITTGKKGSFNLMSLSGDFVIQSPWFAPLCTEVIRKHFASECFASDLKCLIKATLTGKIREDIPSGTCMKCHAGFTEVFAPVFTNGLIVGLVFGGQIIRSEEDANEVMKYAMQKQPTVKGTYSMPKPVANEEIDHTKQMVSGLSALIGLLFERYCIAEKWAELGKELVDLRIEGQREIFQTACHAVKRLLAVSEVSAFRREGDLLVLEATTSTELGIRQKPGDILVNVSSEDAIGKAYYRTGLGLTGWVAREGKSRFEQDATKAEGWAGICSEGREPRQFFAAPILWEDRSYGVLRAVRPSNFSEFPKSDRELIERFASELGIVLNNYELTKAETENFRQKAEELQALLAEAAHEYMSPLHNVLSLSTGIQCTLDLDQLERLRQRMKEEVYRAKRIMENYLLRGVEGREELKYDFRINNLWDLVRECISRFKSPAAKKGVMIKVDYKITKLPEIVFDYSRMDQVFSNIIDNAVKYAFDSTEIVIKGRDKENTVTISVTSMGLGIPKDAMKEIFRGYQRSVEDKRRFKPGTGLGLKIAKEIVEVHKGSISVESRPVWHDPERLALMEGYETKMIVSLPKGSTVKAGN